MYCDIYDKIDFKFQHLKLNWFTPWPWHWRVNCFLFYFIEKLRLTLEFNDAISSCLVVNFSMWSIIVVKFFSLTVFLPLRLKGKFFSTAVASLARQGQYWFEFLLKFISIIWQIAKATSEGGEKFPKVTQHPHNISKGDESWMPDKHIIKQYLLYGNCVMLLYYLAKACCLCTC